MSEPSLPTHLFDPNRFYRRIPGWFFAQVSRLCNRSRTAYNPDHFDVLQTDEGCAVSLLRADDPAMGFKFLLASTGPNGLDPIGQKDYLICHPLAYNADGTRQINTARFIPVARAEKMRQTPFDGKTFDKNTTATEEALSYYYDTTRGAYTVSGPNERIVEDGNTPVGRHVQVILDSYDNVNEIFALITANIPDVGTGVKDWNGKRIVFQETTPRIWSMDNNRAGA